MVFNVEIMRDVRKIVQIIISYGNYVGKTVKSLVIISAE